MEEKIMTDKLQAVLDEPALASLMPEGYSPSAWYRLRFVEPATIVFLVQETMLDWFGVIKGSNFGSAGGYERLLGLTFIGPQSDIWGYDQSIRTVSSGERGWIRYEIEVPPDIWAGNNQRVIAAAASISQLSSVLNEVREQFVADYPVPQLLNFRSVVGKGTAEFGINAFFSRHVVEWAALQNSDRMMPVAYAISKMSQHLLPQEIGLSEGPGCSSVTLDEDGYLYLECIHRVGLIRDGTEKKPTDFDTGYSVHMHNPDNVIDQLSLIAGLAKLYEAVEGWHRYQS